ncbi:SCO family protein [Aquisalimonas lutea]|uniref:SCO family protein n=1 Tax=Aquisalimonas lutea TaxID=1327750 RepID=UPI0025B3A1CD|nr:SCO family protein [Aquisalimonas lutea]MDN3519098.1 SCO family protein [Aquisalimonas lutea]
MIKVRRFAPFYFSLIFFLILLLLGCDEQPEWETSDVTGQFPDLQFELTAETGKTVTEEDFSGKVNLLFFGFTSCPDVCPNTLGRLSQVLRELSPSQRGNVRILFVSVDPQRDNPSRLAEYTDAFGEQFVGMTADQSTLRELTGRYYTTFSYGESDREGNYTVQHNGSVFVFDRDDRARLKITASGVGGIPSDSVNAIVADIRRLIE